MTSQRFWLSVGAIAILAATIRLFVYCQRDYIGHADEGAYTGIAMGLAQGEGLTRGGKPHTHFPPGYPYAISLVLRAGGDPDRAAQVVSLIAGTLLVLALGALARTLYGPWTGLVAAAMVALFPDAVSRATSGMSETLFTLLLLLAILMLLRMVNERAQTTRVVGMIAAGLLFGVCYLIRPEGLALAVLAACATVLAAISREPRRMTAAFGDAALIMAACALVASPYVWYLHDVTGKWQLTGKGPFTALGLSGDEPKPERLYGLTEDGRLRCEVSEELAPSMTELFSLRQYLKRLYDTYNQTIESYTDPLFVALVGIGCVAAVASHRATALALLPLSTWGLAVILPAVHPGRRYLSPIVTILIVWAALGAVHIAGRIAASRSRAKGSSKAEGTAQPWLILVLAVVMIPWLKPSIIDWWQAPRTGEIPLEEKTAAEWIRENLGRDVVLMGSEDRIGHYAGRRSPTTPYADLPAVLAYARAHGVTHLVVTERWTPSLRPRIESLLDPANAPPDLELVYHQETPEGWSCPADVLVYRILPKANGGTGRSVSGTGTPVEGQH